MFLKYWVRHPKISAIVLLRVKINSNSMRRVGLPQFFVFVRDRTSELTNPHWKLCFQSSELLLIGKL